MNNPEARELLTQHLASYKALPYDDLLRRVGDVETAELTGASGQTYQLEVVVFRDSDSVLLVLGTIDDGGWRAFLPMTLDFLVRPGEQLQGE